MRDAGAAHPVDRRVFVELFPKVGDFARVNTDFLANEQRAVTLHNAVGNEPIRGEMRVCA
jgi:hypothetical protein